MYVIYRSDQSIDLMIAYQFRHLLYIYFAVLTKTLKEQMPREEICIINRCRVVMMVFRTSIVYVKGYVQMWMDLKNAGCEAFYQLFSGVYLFGKCGAS